MRIKRQVECVETGERWPDAQAAADALGVSKSSVGGILAPSGAGKKIAGKHLRWADAAAPIAAAKRGRRKIVRQPEIQEFALAPAAPEAPAPIVPARRPSDALRAAEGESAFAGMAALVAGLANRGVKIAGVSIVRIETIEVGAAA